MSIDPPPPPVHTLQVRELTAMAAQLAGAPGPAPVLLDVRDAFELARARLDLPGVRTLHIPMGELPSRLGELDPAQPVLGLCHHGVRSQHCLMLLRRHGFARLYNVAGGIDAWSLQVDPQVPRY